MDFSSPHYTLSVALLLHLHFISVAADETTATVTAGATTFSKTVEMLSDYGYSTMARDVELSLAFRSGGPSLTVFAVSDEEIGYSGERSRDRVRLHLLPIALPLRSLKALPSGAEILTIGGESLKITRRSGDDVVLLNDVIVKESVYDDGSLVILAVDKLFGAAHPKNHRRSCTAWRNDTSVVEYEVFQEVSMVLRSRGLSLMASFLEMEYAFLSMHKNPLTLFTVPDEAVVKGIGQLRQYAAGFRRYMAPVRVSWAQLAAMGEGEELQSYAQGYIIRATWNGHLLLLNNAPILIPEIYGSDAIVVHVVSRMIDPKKERRAIRRILGSDDQKKKSNDFCNSFMKGIGISFGTVVITFLGKELGGMLACRWLSELQFSKKVFLICRLIDWKICEGYFVFIIAPLKVYHLLVPTAEYKPDCCALNISYLKLEAKFEFFEIPEDIMVQVLIEFLHSHDECVAVLDDLVNKSSDNELVCVVRGSWILKPHHVYVACDGEVGYKILMFWYAVLDIWRNNKVCWTLIMK